MNSIISFVKGNSTNIIKIGGIVLSIGGAIFTSLASDRERTAEIAKAVEEFNNSAK